jgi:hypothetical protein
MRNFIAFAIKLLAIAVIAVNLTYIYSGKPLNLTSWANQVQPFLIAGIGIIFIASIILMFTRSIGGTLRMVLLLLILAVTFPLYHPYLIKLKGLLPF